MSDAKSVSACTQGEKHYTRHTTIRGEPFDTPQSFLYEVCGEAAATPEAAEQNLGEALKKEGEVTAKGGGGDYFTNTSSRRFEVCGKVSWVASEGREKLENLGEIWTTRIDSKKICADGDSYLQADQAQEEAASAFAKQNCERKFTDARFSETAQEACKEKGRQSAQVQITFGATERREREYEYGRMGNKW